MGNCKSNNHHIERNISPNLAATPVASVDTTYAVAHPIPSKNEIKVRLETDVSNAIQKYHSLEKKV